jgi:hypothetical protein
MPIDAASAMTRDVITVGPNARVAEVAAVLAKHDISAVPVCDGDGALLGILSEGDLMRPFGAANEMRRAWWLGILAEGTDLAPDPRLHSYGQTQCKGSHDPGGRHGDRADEPVGGCRSDEQAPHQARAGPVRWQSGRDCQPCRRCRGTDPLAERALRSTVRRPQRCREICCRLLDISTHMAHCVCVINKRRVHKEHDSTGQVPSCQLTWHWQPITKSTHCPGHQSRGAETLIFAI